MKVFMIYAPATQYVLAIRGVRISVHHSYIIHYIIIIYFLSQKKLVAKIRLSLIY